MIAQPRSAMRLTVYTNGDPRDRQREAVSSLRTKNPERRLPVDVLERYEYAMGSRVDGDAVRVRGAVLASGRERYVLALEALVKHGHGSRLTYHVEATQPGIQRATIRCVAGSMATSSLFVCTATTMQ